MLGDEYWTDEDRIVHIVKPETGETMCGDPVTAESNTRHLRGCEKCVLEVACALEMRGHAL